MAPCDSDPCQNGGVCFTGQDNQDYTCICLFGWGGTNCEIATNFCDSSPCQNGATCVDQAQGYECQCPQGFTGPTCEVGEWYGS